MSRMKDLTGIRFGMLVVVSRCLIDVAVTAEIQPRYHPQA